MKLIKSLLVLALCALAACNGSGARTAGRAIPKAGNNQTGGGPTVPVVGKIGEKFQDLVLQKTISDPAQYANNMDLTFTDSDKLYFSFNYSPTVDSSLYFDSDQSLMTLSNCKNPLERSFTRAIYWQENLGQKVPRRLIKTFTPTITEFPFKGGKHYILTYALTNVKKEFPDCAGANVKFAVFPQDDHDLPPAK